MLFGPPPGYSPYSMNRQQVQFGFGGKPGQQGDVSQGYPAPGSSAYTPPSSLPGGMGPSTMPAPGGQGVMDTLTPAKPVSNTPSPIGAPPQQAPDMASLMRVLTGARSS